MSLGGEDVRARNANSTYGGLDILKFVFALLIVMAHYISEYAEGRINSLIEYSSSIYVVVVPFFFTCSGFLLFRKEKKTTNFWNVVSEYIKKILIMYLGWSSIYFLFKLMTWIKYGTSVKEVLNYFIHCVTYSTYKTIWYLPALVIGVIITYIIYTKFNIKTLCIVSTMFYMVGCLGVSYSFLVSGTIFERLLNGYNYIFESTRNGIFNGFPFVALGCVIAKNEGETGFYNKSYVPRIVLLLILGIGFIMEAFIIKFKFHAVNVNTLLLLLPFSFILVEIAILCPIKTTPLLVWMRKMSTVIFLSQRLFLSAIPDLNPTGVLIKIWNGNPYIGMIILVLLVMFFSAFIIELGKKSRIIKAIC